MLATVHYLKIVGLIQISTPSLNVQYDPSIAGMEIPGVSGRERL